MAAMVVAMATPIAPTTMAAMVVTSLAPTTLMAAMAAGMGLRYTETRMTWMYPTTLVRHVVPSQENCRRLLNQHFHRLLKRLENRRICQALKPVRCHGILR